MKSFYKSILLASLLAVSLACLSPFSDSAQAAKITVNIVGRPAPPAAIAGWSFALQGDVMAALAGKPLAPGVTNATWTGVNFAKHHIIPQTYLQIAAGLSQLEEVGKAPERLRLADAIRKIAAGAAAGPPAAWNLGPVVWAPINLFDGIDGYYRSGDPGGGGENVKPKSFNRDRWDLLQTALKSLTDAGKIVQHDYISSTKQLNQQQKGGKTGFSKIVEAFEGLAIYNGGVQPAVSPFAATDWVDDNHHTINVANLIVYYDDLVLANISYSKKNAYHLAH